MNPHLKLAIVLVIYLVLGWKIILTAVKNIFRGEIFDENFLMVVATIGALCVGEYEEAILVMLLYRVGEFLQDKAVDKSRKSISDLMDIRPDYANIEQNGEWIKTDPASVAVGTTIFVKPGERIPLDGVVLEGNSRVDTAALTGESLPVDVSEGSEVHSGTINLDGVLRIRTTATSEDSTASRILDLVENAAASRANSEKFITKFARYYTPIVCGLAVLLAVIPPLLFHGVWADWIHRALSFLVVSCPCALVISIPLGFFGGIGGASAKGILIKGGNYLEALSKADAIAFDKTGTLTKGVFKVIAVHPEGISEEDICSIISHGYGVVTDEKEPQTDMEKSLFAVDELTGIVHAYALMRPEGMKGMEVKSLKKKFKDRRFAAKCDRDLIQQGVERLGLELSVVMECCIKGMQAHESELGFEKQ